MKKNELLNNTHAETSAQITAYATAIAALAGGMELRLDLYSKQYTAMYERLKELGVDWDTDPKNTMSEGNINRMKLQAAAEKLKKKGQKTNA